MASNVVVLDNTARKFTIKTTPNKSLSDVLQEACAKKGVDPSQWSLKYGQKTLDLSNTIRFAGLPAGAKLSLVQASSSPAVVRVALDTPGVPRAIHQFPSNTTLWQVLRRFESGVAGGEATRNKNLNYTQRATPLTTGGSGSGAGRLCYEMPVLNVMSRELASFVDLQKTLAQIGVNSGSVAIRLTFRNTQQPLEEAMQEITQYFQEVENPSVKPTNTGSGAHAGGPGNLQSAPNPETVLIPDDIANSHSPDILDIPMPDAPTAADTNIPPGQDVIASSTVTEPPAAPVPSSAAGGIKLQEIFKAPSSGTPQSVAAMRAMKEDEYEPTAAHALAHQARLEKEGRNKRLASDKEIADQEQALMDARAAITKVTVKIVTPDQMAIVFDCFQQTTLKDLYQNCRDVLANPHLKFKLLAINKMGRREALNESSQRLIGDLGWINKENLFMAWADDVPADSRSAPSLSARYQQSARELKVNDVKFDTESDADLKAQAKPTASEQKGKSKMSAEEKESRLLKMMGGGKLFGKK